MSDTTTSPATMEGMSRRAMIGAGVMGAMAVSAPLGAKPAAPAHGKGEVDASRRHIGPLSVSALGLGCMNMSPGWYNPAPDPADMVRVIRQAHDLGVTFFDTAEVYGPYVSEQIVGEGLKPIRGQVVLASKFGFEIDGSATPRGRNARPEHIRMAVDGMLGRLQTDHIDLLYLHRVDPKVPIEDVAGTVRDLIAQGKVRAFGLSEAAPATVRRAHAVQPVAALQNEYSLIERLPEVEAVKLCEELGVALVPWGPTCRGLLADRFNEYSRFAPEDRHANVPYFAPAALATNMAVVRLVRRWADERGVTPVQFALAWLLAQKPFIVPIPGSTKIHHVRENLGALGLRLSADDLAAFRRELDSLPVAGTRPASAALVDQ